MNSTSLLALIVDQHSGELAPEVSELLEAYLYENAEARAEAARARRALAITEQTILRHPDLAPVAAPVAIAPPAVRRTNPNWLATAASIALLAALSGVGGFLAGQKHPRPADSTTAVVDDSPRPARKDSPWARYRFAPDPAGGARQIVRVESSKSSEGTLQ